jgi:hypothetical protein
MNRNYAFVSTCSRDGWTEYGEKFVRSFLKYYPASTRLYMYIDFAPTVKHDRIIYRNTSECYGLESFQNNIGRLPFARGKTIVSDLHIVWNAGKFAFKVFSVEHCVLNAEEDVVTWIDADTIAFRRMNLDFISSLIPPYCLLNYLGRSNKYTECGYVSYNKQDPLCDEFVRNFAELFRSGAIFSLKEWHDSYVFDLLRYVYEQYHGAMTYNISFREMGFDHVFINSPLGKYLDHLKGPRKAEGKSRQSDIKTDHGQSYWGGKKSGKGAVSS